MMPVLLGVAWAAVVLAVGWRRRPMTRSLPPVDDTAVDIGEHPPSAVLRWRGCARGAPHRKPRHAAVTVGLLVVGLVVAGPIPSLAAATTAATVREHRWRRRQREIAEARLASLPAAIDLLAVAVAAGLTAREGLRIVAERGPPPLRSTFGALQARLDTGEALATALPRLVVALGEPARGVVRAITVAERDGAPLRTLLGHLADDARRQRRHEVEAAIKRLPVRLSFPLVCCVLPAFVVLTVVPLLADGLSRLGPIGP